MRRFKVYSWSLAIALIAAASATPGALAIQAPSAGPDEKAVHEPVFRIARVPDENQPQPNEASAAEVQPAQPQPMPAAEIAAATANPNVPAGPAVVRHPLDPAIDLAKSRLEAIRSDLNDYTAIMVKRERIDGVLKDHEYAKIKVRNRRQTDAGNVPFSIYMRFLKPKAIRGREVIYVEGQNNGKLIAHDTGLMGMITVHLDPTGPLAMQNSRYPIYDAGIENLVMKLIEKAERDKAAGDCEVEFVETAKINERPCTKIKVTHPEQKHPFDFNVAEVFIDNELQVPVRYAAYTWPKVAGGEPELIEEYTYLNLEVNKGYTDRDFDPKNPEYEFR